MRVKRFKKGKLTVSRMNEVVDAINANEPNVDNTLRMYRGSTGTVLGVAPQRPGIPFKNNGGETMPAYGVGRITGVSIDALAVPWHLNIDKPSSTFGRHYLVNGDQDVGDGLLGYGYLLDAGNPLPLTFLHDNGTTPAAGQEWGAKPGQWSLSINYPAICNVLGEVDSTNHYVVGIGHPIDTLIGKLAGSLSQGSSATMNVWAGAGNSEAVISSMTVTVYDWLIISGGDPISSGKKVVAKYIDGVLYCIEAECEA